MIEQRRIRIEVVIEEIGLALLTERVVEAGATGWSVIPSVHGRGRQGPREPDHVANISGNVMVFVLAREEHAEAVIAAAVEVVGRFSGLVASQAVTLHTSE